MNSIIGMDSFFQSQTFTYGLCGPLELTTQEAGYLNSAFFGAYLFGRILGIPLSGIITPTILVATNLVGTFFCSILLICVSIWLNTTLMFIGTTMMGFFICYLFGCGINWIINIVSYSQTSSATSVAFVGGHLGNFIYPPIASFIIQRVGNHTLFYLVAVTSFIHFMTFSMTEIWHKTIYKTINNKIAKNLEPEEEVEKLNNGDNHIL